MTYVAETTETNPLLHVLRATSPYTGDAFFDRLTLALSHAAGVRWSFVAELLLDTDRVRLVSLSEDETHLDMWEYDLAGTPGMETIATGQTVYPRGLMSKYPHEPWINAHNAQAFVSTLLRAASGDPIGIMGCLHDEAVDAGPILYLLQEIGPRVAAELERRQVENALRRSESRFRLLAEQAKDILFYCHVQPNIAFEYISPAASEITGYPPEAFRANPNLAVQIVANGDRQKILDAVNNGTEEPVIARLVRADGQQRWIEYRNYPLRDEEGAVMAVGGTIRDVSQRIDGDQALRRSEQAKKALLDAIPDMLFRLDADGTFIDFLPGDATKGFAVSVDRVVGLNIRDALPAFATPLRRLVQKVLHTNHLQRMEFEMSGNTDSRFYEARCIPFGDQEVLLILRDFTAVKWHEGEEERRRLRDEIDNKVERLRANPYGLTYRELAVLHLVAEGSADKQIAESLGISTYTVNKHVANILGKMNAVSRTEAGVRAIREGMLAA
jgi:PAS domain S-box-containing protein